jgi:hypothetical protein
VALLGDAWVEEVGGADGAAGWREQRDPHRGQRGGSATAPCCLSAG